jgi:hypothetical protein
MTAPEPPVTADRAEEPVTWCRTFMQPVCPHPCADCKRTDALLTDEQRERLLAPYRAAIEEATCPS